MSTQAFQRLRNVKQLGLAHLVFPGADYSRFSHCIGVCHVTGRILDSLREYSNEDIQEYEYQKYRLAGLLHDIGHFPFSHAIEEAVSDYYKDKEIIPSLFDTWDQDGRPVDRQTVGDPPLDHEDIGQLLLERDDEFRVILDRNDIPPEDIYSIFTRQQPPRFANLISSDLDADRIDYLLRTAKHTGLPYGSVDIEYILSQLRLDNENRICLTSNALRTAEHFLLGRYFDYQQVTYHKTVAAFEEVLKDVFKRLLELRMFDCSGSGITRMIDSGKWYEFDDLAVLRMIRDVTRYGNQDGVFQAKMDSLLRRLPPKLIGSVEIMVEREQSDDHERNISDLGRVADELAEEFDIDRKLWYVWDSKGRSLTKVGPYAPISMLPADEDDLEQSIRIQEGQESKPIVSVPRSLMSLLAQRASYTARLYVIFPRGRKLDRESITGRAREIFGYSAWVDGK